MRKVKEKKVLIIFVFTLCTSTFETLTMMWTGDFLKPVNCHLSEGGQAQGDAISEQNVTPNSDKDNTLCSVENNIPDPM